MTLETPVAATCGEEPRSEHEAAFHGEGSVLTPASYDELSEVIRSAEASSTPLVPAGLGTRAYLGNPPPPGARVVSLRLFNQVLRYEPGDFTIGVQAGLPLPRLREVLASNGQEVPIDFRIGRGPEGEGHPGTVGGFVARAEPGPRTARYGSVRSYVIGMRAARGGASFYKTGGMVVKNVAGYEISKLLTGSLGTAGVILEVNLKLRPLPARRAARATRFESPAAAWGFVHDLRARSLEPAALWVLGGGAAGNAPARPASLEPLQPPAGGRVVVWLFEGHAERVAWQEEECDRILGRHAAHSSEPLPAPGLERALDFLTELPYPGPRPAGDLAIARISALPSRARALEEAVLAALGGDAGPHGEVALDALGGLLVTRCSGPESALERAIPALAGAARNVDGAGTLVYLPPSIRAAHPYLLAPSPNAPLARKLLRALDPAGIFSPGRILGRG